MHDFVADILAAEPNANVIVVGDLNDFEFSETVHDPQVRRARAT